MEGLNSTHEKEHRMVFKGGSSVERKENVKQGSISVGGGTFGLWLVSMA